MLTVPLFIAVTKPEALTVAINSSLVLQVTVTSLASAGRTAAVN